MLAVEARLVINTISNPIHPAVHSGADKLKTMGITLKQLSGEKVKLINIVMSVSLIQTMMNVRDS